MRLPAYDRREPLRRHMGLIGVGAIRGLMSLGVQMGASNSAGGAVSLSGQGNVLCPFLLSYPYSY